jgi:hypothetical protein
MVARQARHTGSRSEHKVATIIDAVDPAHGMNPQRRTFAARTEELATRTTGLTPAAAVFEMFSYEP